MSDTGGIELRYRRNNFAQIKDAMTAAAMYGFDNFLAEVEQQAKANAPTDTGGLRASGFRISGLTNEFGGSADSLKNANPRATAIAEPNVPETGGAVGFAASYARPVNDGHRTASGGFVPAQPFLDTAWAGLKGELGRFYAEAFQAHGGQG